MGEVFQSPATLIPCAFVWHNYVDIFVRIPMARHLLNSLFIALAAVFFNIIWRLRRPMQWRASSFAGAVYLAWVS